MSYFNGNVWTTWDDNDFGVPATNRYFLDIARHPNGDIWLTSTEGLFRYDGASWTRLTTQNSSLPATDFLQVEIESNGTIWMTGVAPHTLVSYDGSNSVTYNSGNSPLSSGFQNRRLFLDQYGRIWLSNADTSFVFDNSTWSTNSNAYYDIDQDLSGKYWTAGNGDLPVTRFDASSTDTLPFFSNYVPSLTVNPEHPRQVNVMASGRIMISAFYSAGEYDQGTWTIHNENNWQSNFYTDAVEDNSGNLWFVHPLDGVLMYDGVNYTRHTSGQFTQGNWPGYGADAITKDIAGNIWIITFQGLSKWNGSSWTYYNTNNILPNAIFADVEAAPNGDIWAASSKGTVRFDGTNWTVEDTMEAMLLEITSTGEVWICNDYSGASVISSSQVRHYDGQTWTHYDLESLTGLSPFDLLFQTMRIDPQDRLWLGSAFSGILILGEVPVWPGDANSDFIANNFDLLNVGLAFGSTGPIRPNASTAWTAQTAPDWISAFNGGPNYKHADCDGDGVVSWSDVIAISQNYGMSHQKAGGITTATGGADLWLRPLQDSVLAGDTLDLIISLGRDTAQADSVYGIAFSLNFDPTIVDSAKSYISYDSCWLGSSGTNMIDIFQEIYPQGRFEIGLSRTDQLPQTGYGEICRLGIVMQDDVAAKRLTIYRDLELSLNNIQLVDTAGNFLNVNGDVDTVVVYQEETGTIEPAGETFAVIFPNPGQDQLTIVPQLNTAIAYELIDLRGRILHKGSLFGKRPLTVNTALLPEGMYFVRIRTKDHSTALRWLKRF